MQQVNYAKNGGELQTSEWYVLPVKSLDAQLRHNWKVSP